MLKPFNPYLSQLLEVLINEDYTIRRERRPPEDVQVQYVVTDPKLPGWSCHIQYFEFSESSTIVLVSGDGLYSKVYELGSYQDILKVLKDILFMYHCMEK